MTPLYSSKAQRAQAFLEKAYNDFDVFVEDVSCQNVYVRLINRILGDKGRITSVYPLAGRLAVLAACKQDQQPRDRVRLYIIDGDLDLLSGRPLPRLRHLLRLDAYCLENLLLDAEVLLRISLDGMPNTSEAAARRRLGWEELFELVVAQTLPLYVVYAILQALSVPVVTVGFSIVGMCDNDRDPRTLSGARIRGRIRELVRFAYNSAGKQRYRRTRKLVMKELANLGQAVHRTVSGKSVFMPLIQVHLSQCTTLRLRRHELLMRLALEVPIDADPRLKKRLRALATRART